MAAPRFSPKIALLGSGMIGGTAALLAGLEEITNDIVLLDVVPDMPAGKALDLSHALACNGLAAKASGCSDLSENSEGLEGADVVIVTAGFPRKPGMSRDDLLQKNSEIISNVGKAIKARCPGAFVICITNPLDVMVGVLQKASGLPANKVVGMAGMLDSARFRSFLAEELKVSVKDVQAMVMGGHGDDMVPVKGLASVNGIPVSQFVSRGVLSEERLDEIIERTRNGGGEIVSLMKQGSAFVAPAACAVAMAKSYLRNERRVMPCCCFLNGEYGYTDIYAGVPCIIGQNGVEQIIEIELSPEEKAAFNKSIDSVKTLREACRNMGVDA